MDSPFLKTNEQKENNIENKPDLSVPIDGEQTNPIIDIQDLKVVYFAGKNNEARALDGITVQIYPEEYIVFFGPSGCGKSTLLNVIAGLEIPSSGKVSVQEQDLSGLSSNKLAKLHRKKMGMIFQIYNLIPTLNVMDNVLLPQIFERIKPAVRKKLAREMLGRLGLAAFENRLPQELSGGQQQRVGIARALINDPPIILADEAVGNLDSQSAENVLEILNDLNLRYKKTIISVTHNPEHLSYADRILYMKDGKIIKIEINEKRKKLRGKGQEEGIKKVRTELDLLLQAFPDLTSMQLHIMLAPFKAKMLVAYLLNNLESEEIKMLEKNITDRLLENISKEELIHFLDAPADQDGLGLNIETARRFSKIIEEVVEKSDYIKAGSKEMKEGRSGPISDLVDDVRISLLHQYDGDLGPDQVEALNKGIEYRLLSKISKKEFQDFLDTPFSRGGVGLNRKSAKNLSRKLELIMLLRFGK